MLRLLLAGLSPGALRAQGAALVETAPPPAPRDPRSSGRSRPPLLGLDVPAAGSVVHPDGHPPVSRLRPAEALLGGARGPDGGPVHSVRASATFITKEEWAKVSPQTWKNNFTYPWQWDDNDFQNNQFAHPYQGSAYFNSARTNGYDFWASSAWTARRQPDVGVLLRGVGAGPQRPRQHGGRRHRARGSAQPGARTSRWTTRRRGASGSWREIGGALLNPVGGFNRLVRGQTHTVSANPPEWRPSAVLGLLDLGYRQTVQSVGEQRMPKTR